MAGVRRDPGPTDALTTYRSFYWTVAAVQLRRWLPRRPSRILDLSGPGSWCAREAAAGGHTVIEVLDPAHPTGDGTDHGHAPLGGSGRIEATVSLVGRPLVPPALPRTDRPPTRPPAGGSLLPSAGSGPPYGQDGHVLGPHGNGRGGHNGDGLDAVRSGGAAGRSARVIGETRTLGFIADGCVDAVIAENRMLSRHLMTESTAAEMARVLRPGGRLLLSVDSLTLGMAVLAEQNCWAHLSDVPRAEVVLVPWPDGTITRCFWPDQLREVLGEAGFEVEWIRPRTVLSPSTVEHVLASDANALSRLVQTELTAPISDESVGIHLVASARRVAF
ncbi:MAG TPA: methyltransferase [Actinomadura sp.]|jgi:hypothetical protein|nr:methyltransferase [Actinomadura sp.]